VEKRKKNERPKRRRREMRLNWRVIDEIAEACIRAGGDINEVCVIGGQLVIFFDSAEYPIKIIKMEETQ